MPKMTAANPLDRRVQATAEKLRAALDRLARSSVGAPMIERQLTVAALAREARVGRNAIYANHRDILDELIRVRQQRRAPDRIALRRHGVAIMVNKRVQTAVLGCNLKNDRMISVCSKANHSVLQ